MLTTTTLIVSTLKNFLKSYYKRVAYVMFALKYLHLHICLKNKLHEQFFGNNKKNHAKNISNFNFITKSR